MCPGKMLIVFHGQPWSWATIGGGSWATIVGGSWGWVMGNHSWWVMGSHRWWVMGNHRWWAIVCKEVRHFHNDAIVLEIGKKLVCGCIEGLTHVLYWTESSCEP